MAQGWNRLGQNSKHKGWFRGRGEERELLIYVEFDGTDSLAFGYGFDLARKRLPRSFVEALAADHGNGFFGRVLLNGFDSFSRPPKIREDA
jgi:hypothetical protein